MQDLFVVTYIYLLAVVATISSFASETNFSSEFKYAVPVGMLCTT